MSHGADFVIVFDMASRSPASPRTSSWRGTNGGIATVTKVDDKELSVTPPRTQIVAQSNRDEGDDDPIKRIIAVRCGALPADNTCVRCG